MPRYDAYIPLELCIEGVEASDRTIAERLVDRMEKDHGLRQKMHDLIAEWAHDHGFSKKVGLYYADRDIDLMDSDEEWS